MNRKDFWFDLPDELIAQAPIDRRDRSRLLCLDRNSGVIRHQYFYQLPDVLREGDCLVMNDSRVLPARLFGKRETGGAVELLLLRDLGDKTWECLVRPGRRIKTGAILIFGENELSAEVVGSANGGNRFVKFNCNESFAIVLERLGKMPLPHYIHQELEDAERYQTVYSRVSGSAAAPTAGLHFTDELLQRLEARGIGLCFITLHVGLGTFRPVRAELVEEHEMHSEHFDISKEAADAINRTKTAGGRVIAVGTTSCRALESCEVMPQSGFTDIFIYPGYEFKCIDGLVTNFHLPESTLIMLVSALAGRERILQAYEEAIRDRYRFYSFGDAMLIL